MVRVAEHIAKVFQYWPIKNHAAGRIISSYKHPSRATKMPQNVVLASVESCTEHHVPYIIDQCRVQNVRKEHAIALYYFL